MFYTPRFLDYGGWQQLNEIRTQFLVELSVLVSLYFFVACIIIYGVSKLLTNATSSGIK